MKLDSPTTIDYSSAIIYLPGAPTHKFLEMRLKGAPIAINDNWSRHGPTLFVRAAWAIVEFNPFPVEEGANEQAPPPAFPGFREPPGRGQDEKIYGISDELVPHHTEMVVADVNTVKNVLLQLHEHLLKVHPLDPSSYDLDNMAERINIFSYERRGFDAEPGREPEFKGYAARNIFGQYDLFDELARAALRLRGIPQVVLDRQYQRLNEYLSSLTFEAPRPHRSQHFHEIRAGSLYDLVLGLHLMLVNQPMLSKL